MQAIAGGSFSLRTRRIREPSGNMATDSETTEASGVAGISGWSRALLESPGFYRLWQAPWATAKLAPVLAHSDLSRVRRVLDLGCGPGTNAPVFEDCEYVGIDINPRYIENARARYRGEFVVADLRDLTLDDFGQFDFILINSLLHHIAEEDLLRILRRARSLLSADGQIHVVDLILPARRSVARSIALRDRGEFARPLAEWRRLFSQVFEVQVFEPFDLRNFGVTLWQLVYFRGGVSA
jgi:SAM-dependent methyltransferase